jgi:hypothetical protein
LNSAIVLQPLSQTQLQNCLQQLGSLHGIDDMLTQDPALKEIIDTPLMLNIAARAYPQLKQHMHRSPELLKTELFAAYAREMLKHRGEKRGYSRAESLHYLSWLAKKLIDKKQSVFFIERMQPDWLPTAWQRWCVTTGSMVICGVMVGLILGFYGSLFHDLYISLAIALSYGIVGSIMCGWMGVAAQIRPVTRVKLSLHIFQKRTYRNLLEALLIGVFTGTGVAYLVHWQAGIIAIFFMAIVFAIFLLLDIQLLETNNKRYLRPNHGMYIAGIYTLYVGLCTGVVVGTIGYLLDGPATGLFLGAEIGLIMGLYFGGHPFIQHYILRYFLWRNGVTPRNYVAFLNHCVDNIFLYRVAGGYLFIHRSLLEYFAALAGYSGDVPHSFRTNGNT